MVRRTLRWSGCAMRRRRAVGGAARARAFGAACCVTLGLIAAAPPVDADAWTGPDKRKHAFYGTAAGIGAFEVAAAFDAPPWLCVASGVGSGLLLGVGKEAWDARGHGDPSVRDAVWTVAPALVISGLLGWLLGRERASRAAVVQP